MKICKIECMKLKKIFTEAVKWALAAMTALIIMNLLTFAYYSPFSELPRAQGANTGFLYPETHGVYGLEGYSFAHSDHRGYINRDLPLDKDYILVAGASHTEGLFLPMKYRFSDILNDMLGAEDTLKVYNIGKSGNFFSVVTQHLDGILGEFPDAKAIVIETDTLAYDTKAWLDSMIQTGYDPDETAENLVSGLSGRQKLSIRLKQSLPLLRELHKQYLTWKEGATGNERQSDVYTGEFDEDFDNALNSLMAYIRSRTDKQVIIVYHPAVSVLKDGSMKILTNGCEEHFAKACRDNGIDFIDMSDTFLKEYETRHIVPNGFFNTTMGSGHTNRAAHRMMAEAIYKVLKK
ncbi:MAG: hypothetical protein K5886_01390 [Lachnospiraceae bacterium]|nr:hypothetical protein [Lachnospiraceae bacterium]